EELDREERAAEGPVALDALDHARRGAPDAVLLERRPEVPAVDLLRLLERRARGGVVLGDHDDALLRHLERVEVAPDLVAAAAQRLALGAGRRLEAGHVVPRVGVPGGDPHQPALPAAADQDRGRPGGPRLAGRALDAEVAALEVHRVLAPQPLQDQHALLERAHALAERRGRAAGGAGTRPQPARPPAGGGPPPRRPGGRRGLPGGPPPGGAERGGARRP